MQYTIRRASSALTPPAAEPRPVWDGADVAPITHYQRPDSGHRPPTEARVLYDDDGLSVAFTVDDHYVRAVAENFNDMVCQDSCVEFFVSPFADPATDPFFNFEVNCGGTMLLYRCPGTAESAAGTERVHLPDEDGALIAIAASLPKRIEPEISEPTSWRVEYHVPWSLFTRYFDVEPPSAGTIWRGNFYKCGDHTSHPHWGTWAPMASVKKGFHQPEFFQPLHFE